MTLGKLKELLEDMTASQLKKEVIIHVQDSEIHIKGINLLRDEETGKIYPALIA